MTSDSMNNIMRGSSVRLGSFQMKGIGSQENYNFGKNSQRALIQKIKQQIEQLREIGVLL